MLDMARYSRSGSNSSFVTYLWFCFCINWWGFTQCRAGDWNHIIHVRPALIDATAFPLSTCNTMVLSLRTFCCVVGPLLRVHTMSCLRSSVVSVLAISSVTRGSMELPVKLGPLVSIDPSFLICWSLSFTIYILKLLFKCEYVSKGYSWTSLSNLYSWRIIVSCVECTCASYNNRWTCSQQLNPLISG